MQLKNSASKWGALAIGFHWLSAVSIFGLFMLGLWMVELSYYDDWYKTAPYIHKSIGVCLFILTILRLSWRQYNITPEKLKSHSSFEQKAAHKIHIALYLIIFSVMLSGYLISTADGRAVEVFKLFQVPAVIHGIEKQEDIAGIIHLYLAILLISVALFHAAAAIKHHYIDQDQTLKRMIGR